MDLTPRLSLNKPANVGEVMNIDDLNANADTLDANVGAYVCTSASRPASPYTGQVIFETDTKARLLWDGDSWEALGVIVCTSGTRPTPVVIGQVIYETDSYRSYKRTSAGWMQMEPYVTTNYFTSGGGKVASGTAVMANQAFPAWAGQSMVIIEIDGQVGFETVAVDVGVTLSITSSLANGSVAASQAVQAVATKWATISHKCAFVIAGGVATSEAGFVINVTGGQSYYRLNVKITRLPYPVYSSAGAM